MKPKQNGLLFLKDFPLGCVSAKNKFSIILLFYNIIFLDVRFIRMINSQFIPSVY